MWHMNNVGWAWWLLMSIGMVAFWGLLIYAVVMLVRGSAEKDNTRPSEPPQTVLKRRLAAGEISVDEYEQLRDALEDTPREPAGVG